MTKTKKLTKSATSRARLFALHARIHLAIWLSKGLRCSEGAGGPKLWALPIVAVSITGDSDQLPRSFAVARGTYAIKILATNTAHVKTFGSLCCRSLENFKRTNRSRGPTAVRARPMGAKFSTLQTTCARILWSAPPPALHAGAEPPAGRPGAPGAPAPDLGAAGRALLEGCSPP